MGLTSRGCLGLMSRGCFGADVEGVFGADVEGVFGADVEGVFGADVEGVFGADVERGVMADLYNVSRLISRWLFFPGDIVCVCVWGGGGGGGNGRAVFWADMKGVFRARIEWAHRADVRVFVSVFSLRMISRGCFRFME